MLSIHQLRLWAIPSLKRESISVAGACMSFGHASNGPDFDTELSRNVNLLRLMVDLPLIVPEYRKKTLSHREILNATSAFMV
jgi:hypothetical protein